jgi:hypothetical protein
MDISLRNITATAKPECDTCPKICVGGNLAVEHLVGNGICLGVDTLLTKLIGDQGLYVNDDFWPLLKKTVDLVGREGIARIRVRNRTW